MKIRIGPGGRVFALVVVGVLALTIVQGGAESVQSAPAANSQCVVPTPTVFLGDPLAVQIDVKPGNRQNRINTQSEGVVTIAICSEDADGKPPQTSGEFNAPAQVVVKCNPTGPFPTSPSCRNHLVPPAGLPDSSPTAGATGVELSLHSCSGERDINGDGAKDLVCHFFTNRMNLTPTSTTITLSGCCKTPEFEGTNAINCEADCPPSFPPVDY